MARFHAAVFILLLACGCAPRVLVAAAAALNLTDCGITADSPWGRVPGCECLERFAFDGCREEDPHFVCSGLSEIPVHLPVLNISCLVIIDSDIVELRPEHLEQFPTIQGLLIQNTKLKTVAPNTFNFSRSLSHISMLHNRLTAMPPISNICSLLHVNMSYNEIEDFQPHHWENSYSIINADFSHNRIRKLVDGLFAEKCALSQFRISNNPLSVIEPTAFTGGAIHLLDVSFTELSSLPHEGLRPFLLELFIAGTPSFRSFSPSLPDDPVDNRTFPLLTRVQFTYTAHCCQLRGFKFLTSPPPDLSGKRYIESGTRFIRPDSGIENTRKIIDDRFLLPLGFGDSSRALKRHSRQIVADTCVNVASRTCVDPSSVSSAASNTLTTTEEFCSSFDLCDPCLDGVCPNSCANSTSQIGSGDVALDIVCLQLTSQPTDPPTMQPTGPTCEDISMIVNRTQCVHYCAPNNAYCSTFYPGFDSDFCNDCHNSGCRNGGHCEAVYGAPLCTCTSSNPSEEEQCETREVYALCNNCTSLVATTTQPVTTPTGDGGGSQGCNCDGIFNQEFCNECIDNGCTGSGCSFVFSSICTCLANSMRKRRSSISEFEESRFKRFAVGDQFFPDPNPMDLTCTEIEPPTTPTPMSTPSNVCVTRCLQPDDLNSLVNSEDDTVCFPVEGPFNPCVNLLGDSDLLRAAIWIVILVAVVLNLMVICVFLGYTCVIRRMKQEFFIVHFFYFNLAISDLLMGLYLFSIAVVDLQTLDDFFASDIVWRTRGGCNFAGMCAIVSTVVSVYVLVVITIERTVTIVNVMSRRKISKAVGFIVMFFGWILGIIMGFLPLVGISSYTTTAICLPFDVTEPEDIGYVFFLLLATGLSFLVIALAYIVIFYKVFCSKEKRQLQSSGSKWKTELKVALRMSLLIITNFACWFPIALLGSSAAFGMPIVNNLEFAKVVMVFVFPINAMLNPILYSLSTRIFRENIVLLLNKCGACKRQGSDIRNRRAGITPSVTSNRSMPSSSGAVPLRSRRRGTLMERLLSLNSLGSNADISGRRGSTLSQESNGNEQGLKVYFMNTFKRRGSNLSGNSCEESPLARNSRRSSTFSGSSSEDQVTTFGNVGYRPNSPGNSNREHHREPSSVPLKVAVRPKISNSSVGGLPSLGAVPEESEVVAPTGEGDIKVNPAYMEGDEPEVVTSSLPQHHHHHHQNGVIHHSVVQLNSSESSSNDYPDNGINEEEEEEEKQNASNAEDSGVSTTEDSGVNSATNSGDHSNTAASDSHSISSDSLEKNDSSHATEQISETVTIEFD